MYRKLVVYDICGATIFAGTKFDALDNPIAPAGMLDSSILPGTRT